MECEFQSINEIDNWLEIPLKQIPKTHSFSLDEWKNDQILLQNIFTAKKETEELSPLKCLGPE